MPLGSFRLNGLSKKLSSPIIRIASTVSGSRPATTTGIFSNSIRYASGTGTNNFSINMPVTVGNAATTIEMWLWFNASPYAGCKAFQIGSILLLTDTNNWNLRDGTNSSSNSITTTGVSNSTFTHVCLQTSGNNTWHWWVNGTYRTSFSKTTSFNNISVGKMFYQGFESSVELRVDEIRVSNIQRYTSGSNLTVPSAAFVNDSNTVALFHCNTTSETDDIS